MRQLTDIDIEQMIGTEHAPDDVATRRAVRAELHMSRRIPHTKHIPEHATLDLHQLTEEQAWTAIMDLATSGTRSANIIAGASGILKIKFQQWARDSILSPYIISFPAINHCIYVLEFLKQRRAP